MENCNLSERLIQAIRKRNNLSTPADDIQKLIDQGADVNKRHSDGTLPIDWACRNSDVYCVQLLLHNGARVDDSELTALTNLARDNDSNSIDCLKLLLEYGSDVNICDSRNRTLLYWAAHRNNIDCVKLLVQHGANTNVCNSKNETPLYWAAFNNNVDCVKLLLQHGADTNICDNDNNRTPLYWAASNIDCVKLLLQHGADTNICNNDNNRTPLYWAAYDNNIDCVKLLLHHGAKIDVLDNNHNTPLNLAACYCHLEMIKTLLEYNANVNNINLDGQSPLMQVAGTVSEFNTERNMACLELLIHASGQFDLRDENGELKPDIILFCDDDSKRELSEMLLPYCVNPRSLKELCRHQIRSSLYQQFLPAVVPSLNLPKMLEKFVLLQ